MIEKIRKEVDLEGFHLINGMYDRYGKQVAHFSNNIVDIYIITDGKNIIDIQVD